MYRDPTGERKGKVTVYPDQPASAAKGLEPIMRNPSTQEPGNARAEQMLSDSRSTVHALNDYATRSALAERGLSRGVNSADNVHHQQAVAGVASRWTAGHHASPGHTSRPPGPRPGPQPKHPMTKQ